MKSLFIALICTVIGFSASANDLTPKKASPALTRVITKTNNNKNDIKVSNHEIIENGFFRRQKAFLVHDMCGRDLIIYVSGPHSATDTDLWGTAVLWAYENSKNCLY